ncbi:MAG: ATP-binding protein [Acidobacteria bacterium]|nr:ATP-binding protein [Acidobacteriota bacterium]
MEAYKDSVEHLRDELSRLDVLLQRALLVARRADAASAAEEFRGLVISEPEIDALVQAKDFFGERWRRQDAMREELSAIDQQIEKIHQDIDERRKLTDAAGTWLALPWIAQRFNLSPAEVDVLLLTIAVELEPHYETLYAYLQNDVTRKRPSVNLALNLICRNEGEKIAARTIFSPSASLFANRLLDLVEEPQERNAPLLRKSLRTDEAVVAFLLEQPAITSSAATLIDPAAADHMSELNTSTQEQLRNLAAYLNRTDRRTIALRVIGQSEVALTSAAEALCTSLRRRLLLVDVNQLGTDEAYVSRLMRDSVLWGAILAVRERETAVAGADSQTVNQSLTLLWNALRVFGEPIFLLGAESAFVNIPINIRVWRMEVQPPGFTQRRQTWEAALGSSTGEADPARLADTFRFGAQRIHQTIDMARSLMAVRKATEKEPEIQDLLDAGRALTSPQVSRYALRVEPRYGWNDIVLPPEKAQKLRHIASWIKFRRTVHRDWGFGQKLSRGKGLNVLFTGPSGTGKTMAAEVLAGELSLDLYQIDLSTVVSKYIGETEKNLSAIFREAEQTQTLLFFDEADALFGKRTEVKDAHDRYANIEVNYLLQRVEQYEGVVILATNLQQNLDDAFLRRMQEVLEFPFPDAALRESIWRGHFPKGAPTAADINFQFLAQNFKWPGGNIKNIVLSAAFLAAQESKPIGMSHLILATRAEYQKEGRLAIKTDFGPYYDLIARSA